MLTACLPFRLIKLDKEYRSYYLKGEIIFFINKYIISNELLAQRFSEYSMDLDCFSENVSISGLRDPQNCCIKVAVV